MRTLKHSIYFLMVVMLGFYAVSIGSAHLFASTELRSVTQIGASTLKTAEQLNQTVGLKLSQLIPGLDLDSSLQMQQLDLSRVELKNPKLVLTPLGQGNLQNYTGKINVDFARQGWILSGGLLHTLKSEYYFSKAISLSLAKLLNQQATMLKVSVQKNWNQKPVDYYLNSNFKVVSRPTQIQNSSVTLSAEQVLSERWKTCLQGTLFSATEERPQGYGILLQNAYALSSRLFLKWNLAYDTDAGVEESGLNLKDDRGYMRAGSSKLEFTYEPLMDLLLSVSYGLTIERELDPRFQTLLQTGADHYGFGVSYDFGKALMNLQGKIERTNDHQRYVSGVGGLTWRI